MALERFDLAVIGSGFGGSITAMVAARLGHRVLLLERDRHPRFAMGESATPMADLVLQQLADRYDLPFLWSLSEYGRWMRKCPQLMRGLKRGFTFYSHQPGQRFRPRADHANELLIAASPNEELADTHWLRADVDAFLVEQARSLGVDYVDGVGIERIDLDEPAEVRLAGQRGGRQFEARARFVVDASGPRGCLSRLLSIPEEPWPSQNEIAGLFTHLEGVREWGGMPEGRCGAGAPYPPDRSAVHHVFPGGWVWALRFDDDVVSAGVAAERWLAEELGLAEGEAGWRRLLARFPSIGTQFAEARSIRPWTYVARLPYRASSWVGERWALLPSAGAFVDPLLSTGIALTLLGVERLGEAFRHEIGSWEFAEALEQYESACSGEAAYVERLVSGCYAAMGRFDLFAAMVMFYMAGAAYGEMERRLHPEGPHGLFLAAGHPWLGPAFERRRRELERLLARDAPEEERADFVAGVRQDIEPLNVGGFGDPARRNWYPVRTEDLVSNAAKLGITASEMREFITRQGWPAPVETVSA